MRIRDLKVCTVAVSELRPYDRNPRTHSKKQLRQIAESIRTFGWTNPILIDGSPQRLAVEAAGFEVAEDGMRIEL